HEWLGLDRLHQPGRAQTFQGPSSDRMRACRRLAGEQEKEATVAAPEQLDPAPSTLQEDALPIAGAHGFDASRRIVIDLVAAARQMLRGYGFHRRPVDYRVAEAARRRGLGQHLVAHALHD